MGAIAKMNVLMLLSLMMLFLLLLLLLAHFKLYYFIGIKKKLKSNLCLNCFSFVENWWRSHFKWSGSHWYLNTQIKFDLKQRISIFEILCILYCISQEFGLGIYINGFRALSRMFRIYFFFQFWIHTST